MPWRGLFYIDVLFVVSNLHSVFVLEPFYASQNMYLLMKLGIIDLIACLYVYCIVIVIN